MAEILLAWSPGRNSVGTLTAKAGNDVLAVEKIDILNPAKRDGFVNRLVAGRPGIDGDRVRDELLRLAAREAEAPPTDAGSEDAGDVRIVRPELFHTGDVSGIAVPAPRIIGGKPVGRWEMFLRWHADGKRERRELTSMLDVPGGRLCLHPEPSAPSPTMLSGWSAEARADWLDGAAAPDPARVLKRLCERIAHYLEFGPDAAEGNTVTLALWTLLTYAFPVWPAVPYLSIGGPMESGKSTLFRVLARLVFRPLESSNMTAPTMFRSLHEQGGVLLLDEAERLRDGTPEAGELRSILLSGYKRGSPASRLEKCADRFRRVEFDVYGPKALAAIAALPEALASRCIRVNMFRASADSPKPRRRIDADPETWAGLRDDLHALALEHGREWLARADQADVVPVGLSGRDFELWQPLLALASWLDARGAEGLLGLVREHAESAVDATRDDSVNEADEVLLRLLAERVRDGTHRHTKAGDLLKAAREVDPASFARWTPKGAANALARYGIRTRKGRVSAGRLYGDVTLAKLRSIEAAYNFDLGLPWEHVPNVPTRTDASAPT